MFVLYVPKTTTQSHGCSFEAVRWYRIPQTVSCLLHNEPRDAKNCNSHHALPASWCERLPSIFIKFAFFSSPAQLKYLFSQMQNLFSSSILLRFIDYFSKGPGIDGRVSQIRVVTFAKSAGGLSKHDFRRRNNVKTSRTPNPNRLRVNSFKRMKMFMTQTHFASV